MAKKKQASTLKQGIGTRDTDHGLLDLPVHPWDPDERKRKRVRFAEGGSVSNGQRLLDKMFPPKGKAAADAAADKHIRALEYADWDAAGERERRGNSFATKAEDKKRVEGTTSSRYKKGGVVRCADGCAVRGRTRGRFV